MSSHNQRLPVLLALLGALFLEARASGADLIGTVRDPFGRPVAGATVTAPGAAPARTDDSGRFRIDLPAGEHELRVTYPGLAAVTRRVIAGGTAELDVTLALRQAAEVVVKAIRADADVPVTKTDLTREELEPELRGQEMPFLLQRAPSVTITSDAGSATGYSYFSIRGIGQTRLNITLDGAPLNDPEESALYFSNFGDFGGAIGSAQIQRGVGASTVGAASYGGSVNFTSLDPEPAFSIAGELGAGSFGTRHGAVTLQSGTLPGGFQAWGRVSLQDSDGFRDHSGTKQDAVYFGVSRQDESSVLKVSGFLGHARNQLAYLATEEAVLREDLRSNPLSEDETDDFRQSFFQAQYTRFLNERTSFSLQGYYNGASGTFFIQDTVDRQTLYHYGIDGSFAGGVVSLHHDQRPFRLEASLHYGSFSRDHFLDVVGQPDRLYTNTGEKREATGFVKVSYDRGPWHLYADAQLRWARFGYEGDLDLGSVSWTFFNPKVGVRRDLGDGISAYLSLGQARREPTRSDLLVGEDNASVPYDLTAVSPEKVFDVELGVEAKGRSLDLAANLYDMELRDEIALTGELSEIGLPVRRNVDRSYRRGLELSATWRARPELTLRSSLNVNRSRIRTWSQFYDVYGADGAYVTTLSRRHEDVEPLLTPPVTANLSLTVTPIEEASLTMMARYLSRAHLDNTGNDGFRTPDQVRLDVSLVVGLGRVAPDLRPQLRLQVDNVFDSERLWPGGYSYQYLNRDAQGRDTLTGASYYYPQATRSFFVTIDFRM